MGDIVFEEDAGGDFEAFLGIEAGGLDLGIQAQAGGAHGFRGVADAVAEDPPAEAGSPHVRGGDDAADLDRAGLAGFPEKPEEGLDGAAVPGIEQMHGIIVLAVGFRVGTVLLDDEDGLPEPEDFVEFDRSEVGEFLDDQFQDAFD